MVGFLKRWAQKVWQFGLDTVRLQSYCSIPYLMTVNSLFCFICFYASREVQFRALYALIGFILLTDLVLTERKQNFLVASIYWIFTDFLKSISVLLLAISIHSLEKKGGEQKAFFYSLTAVSFIILSPVYHHYRVNARIASFARRLGRALKRFVARFVVRPLLLLWEWTKWVLLLRWVPMLGSHLRSWCLSAWDWLDARLFSPLAQLGRKLKAALFYVLLFRWCADLWGVLRRVLFAPLAIQLGRLLDGFIYVFGCYWLKPLLFRIARFTGDLTKSTVRLLGRLCLQLAALTVEHLVWPLCLIVGDQLEQLGVFIYRWALHPMLGLLWREYQLVETMLLVHVLGPLLKRLLDALPQRNPLEQDSEDHELDEFMPDMGDENENSENEEPGSDLAANSARTLDLSTGGRQTGCNDDLLDLVERSSTSSQFSIEEEAKALAPGIRQIDISESDSDTDAFLPSSRRRRRAVQ